MSELERDLQLLHRYHDGELAGVERALFERRLRRSPALRDELRVLEDVSRLVAGAELDASAPPDLWSGIASALPAIDAQVADERASAAASPAAPADGPARTRGRTGWLGLPGWALGTGALAAAAALALFVVVQTSGVPDLPGEPPTAAQPRAVPAAASVFAHRSGSVRYLDSGGASVMVIEDEAADMTIVWMMDAV